MSDGITVSLPFLLVNRYWLRVHRKALRLPRSSKLALAMTSENTNKTGNAPRE
jgi:hypothetical protein